MSSNSRSWAVSCVLGILALDLSERMHYGLDDDVAAVYVPSVMS